MADGIRPAVERTVASLTDVRWSSTVGMVMRISGGCAAQLGEVLSGNGGVLLQRLKERVEVARPATLVSSSGDGVPARNQQ